jgi:hypothetical protein
MRARISLSVFSLLIASAARVSAQDCPYVIVATDPSPHYTCVSACPNGTVSQVIEWPNKGQKACQSPLPENGRSPAPNDKAEIPTSSRSQSLLNRTAAALGFPQSDSTDDSLAAPTPAMTSPRLESAVKQRPADAPPAGRNALTAASWISIKSSLNGYSSTTRTGFPSILITTDAWIGATRRNIWPRYSAFR